MLGLARALPKVEFRKSGGYLHPVWRGKVLKRRPQFGNFKSKLEAR